jgi:putative FmdB family regulatory protein
MPFYEYFCNHCKEIFKTYHSANDRAEKCERCESKEVIKTIPQLTISRTDKQEHGRKVEKFIEDSREVLKEQLAESRKDYNP